MEHIDFDAQLCINISNFNEHSDKLDIYHSTLWKCLQELRHVLHAFAPTSVKHMDFRTGRSMKNNLPYWSEFPHWFRTILNWVRTIQTIPKTLSDLV